MKILLLITSIATLILATESASAQISLTPRISHSYEKLSASGKVHNNVDQSEEKVHGTSYFNSQRFDLEVAYAADQNFEWLLNVGYMPLYLGADTKNDLYNFDIGVRTSFNNVYAQISLGAQNYKNKKSDGFGGESWTLPTAGIGFGYLIPLASTVSLDLFYRGFISLAASNSERSAVEIDNLNNIEIASFHTKIESIENHQLGLGFRINL